MTTIYLNDQQIGTRYIIKNYLDAGGMQEVYKAYDKVLQKEVALKTPKNQHAEKRFKRSAVVSAKVNHFNVAKTLDYFEHENRAVLIEEFIEGKSLNKLLDSDFIFFDPFLSSQFGHHLAKGVAASHHANVIHRDLKPGNIMVEIKEGIYSFKITDFGIAKLTEEELEEAHKDRSSITGSQTMMGAIPYMAPEMINGPKYAVKASDVWSIGAILYRLLIGSLPYGSGLQAIPRIDKADLPDKPNESYHNLIQFSWLVGELWDIIKTCLQKEPTKRPVADSLVQKFESLCYGVFPRHEGSIKNYKDGTGNWGFIYSSQGDVFFHRQSFYGKSDVIKVGQRVQFSKHRGGGADRAYPVIPLLQK
jgi:serine/threonine-protein kinase